VTEGYDHEHSAEAVATPPATDQTHGESAMSTPPAGGTAQTIWWLATLLLLVIAGVGSSPFWARQVAPLLPWSSSQPAAPSEDYGDLAARVAAIEKRPAPPPPDLGAINSAADALARRVDSLEAARNADRPADVAPAVTKAELQRLEDGLSALETRSASRASGETAEFGKLRQELAQSAHVSADLADRLSAVERRLGAAGASRTNGALLAALSRMHEAIETARPFVSEYDAFTALAHDQPDLIGAAQPLAGLTQAGVPSRAALSDQLGKLSGRIAPPAPSPVASYLPAQARAWIHSLVTIRRIDASAQTGQEPAVRVAEAALARGDLPGAVSALQTASGSSSGAVQSWLQTAHERLTAEAALAHLQELLVARLGTPAEAPAGMPTEAPAKSAQPS
jgi:hypothetical protein